MLRILPLLIVLLIVDLFFWWQMIKPCQWYWQILYFVPLVAVAVLMSLVQSSMYQAWMFRWGATLMLVFFAPKLLFMLCSLLGLGSDLIVNHLFHGHVPLIRWFNIAGLSMGGIVLAMVLYGSIWGYKRLEKVEQPVCFDDLPKGFDGYRIVQLSDLHVGTYESSPETVERIVNEVNALRPDLIVFTGDLVNSSPHELDEFMNIFPRLHAKDGVYSIMGNHDYCMYQQYDYPAQRLEAVSDLQKREAQFGWKLLNNANVILHHNGDSIMLAGVENSSKPPFPDYGDLNKALKDEGLMLKDESLRLRDEGVKGSPLFTILLSHDPTHWRRKVLGETSVQLQLSGHTHATQFRVFGWSPASWVYREWGGLYNADPERNVSYGGNAKPDQTGRQLYVSTGTGGNLAFRFGVYPTITVLTLKRSEK